MLERSVETEFYSVSLAWHIYLRYFDAKLQKNKEESKYFCIFAALFFNMTQYEEF